MQEAELLCLSFGKVWMLPLCNIQKKGTDYPGLQETVLCSCMLDVYF